MITIKSKKLRTAIRIILPILVIPPVAIFGTAVFGEKRHLFISIFIALLSTLLFISGFERRQTGSRRMVLVSIMTALAVVGRFIPFFKPVTAITAISAVYLGGEAGFLIGALSALISNFYFGQGPWTPFQMLAWGFIGLFAGMLSKWLKKSRMALVSYGVITGILFSMIMDIWTVLWYNSSFSTSLYLAAIAAALPHTALYAISNFLFLFFMHKPFGEKLSRIKLKYGI